MTSIVDSVAHFDARLLEGGLTQATLDAIKTAGMDTMSRLAFAVGQPNQPLVDDEITTFLQRALTRAPSLQETSTVKRIAFEAQTYLVASLRQSLEQTDDSMPRKIAFAERTSRMNAIRAGLSGVSVTGETEPSHGLLDKACALFDKNVIAWLERSICVSRTLEVQGGKQTRELSLEKGSLVLKNQDNLSSPTDSEIKLHNALLRRGIALQFAKVMSHSEHSQWVTFLFSPNSLLLGVLNALKNGRLGAGWSGRVPGRLVSHFLSFVSGLSPTSFHLSPSSFHLSPRLGACGRVRGWLVSHFL